MDEYMTTAELARALRVTPQTIRKRIRKGVITCVLTNGAEGNGKRYLVDVTREYDTSSRQTGTR